MGPRAQPHTARPLLVTGVWEIIRAGNLTFFHSVPAGEKFSKGTPIFYVNPWAPQWSTNSWERNSKIAHQSRDIRVKPYIKTPFFRVRKKSCLQIFDILGGLMLPSIVRLSDFPSHRTVLPPIDMRIRCITAEKALKMAHFSKTGSRNTAETCAINFSYPTSYSTSKKIVIVGLSAILLPFLIWAGPDLVNFAQNRLSRTRRQVLAPLPSASNIVASSKFKLYPWSTSSNKVFIFSYVTRLAAEKLCVELY